MSKIGQYVVYFGGMGTNTQHYFNTYEEAEKYLKSSSVSGIYIAYVLAESKTTIDKAKAAVLKFLGMQQ